MMKETIFNEGKKQSIVDILASKDRRVEMQQELFQGYSEQVIVNVNMNIPGPIKNNRYLRQIFDVGMQDLEQSFQKHGLMYRLEIHWDLDSGEENFYLLSGTMKEVKLATVAFEEESFFGRLFDADVLANRQPAISRKDLGLPARKCFICDRPAKECARSRKHSVEEMQAYITALYNKKFS